MDSFFWLALWLIPGLGPVGFKRLLEKIGPPAKIWESSSEELRAAGLPERLVGAITQKITWSRAEEELKRLEDMGLKIIHLGEPHYPELLRQIPDAPPILYLKGNLVPSGQAIAIVGSRHPSNYGLRLAKELARDLARTGTIIVSGAAQGIDTAAHQGALEAGGVTWAVLGTGLDVTYPRSNQGLLEEISHTGALISEFPLGTGPRRENFPIRNRIISGLCQAVVVVEASPKSGSLITARLAGEQGREVMAVPGSVYSYKSRGCHRLIKEGAALVESPEDVLLSLGLREDKEHGSPLLDDPDLPPDAQQIWQVLDFYPLHLEEIAQKIGLDISRIAGILLELELAGLVEALPGGHYQRRPR